MLKVCIFDKFEKISELLDFAEIYNFNVDIGDMTGTNYVDLYKKNIKIFFVPDTKPLAEKIVDEFILLGFAKLSCAKEVMQDRFIMELL